MHTDPINQNSLRSRLLLPALFVVTALVYLPHVLTAEWVYEDARTFDGLASPTWASVTGWVHAPFGRFLTGLSFQVNHWFGAGPRGFHVTSVGLHLLNGALVYILAARSRIRHPLAATSAAAMFLLHPIQSETVAYAAVRGDLLVATFILLSCLCVTSWWSTPPLRAVAAASVFAWLAIHTKESAVASLPVIVVSWRNAAIAVKLRRVIPYALAGAMAAVLLFQSYGDMARWYGKSESADDYTTLEHAHGQLASIARLAALTVLPNPRWLNVDPDLHPIARLPEPALILAAMVATSTAAWAVAAIGRPATFALIWIAASVGWRLFVRTGQWTLEHHWYLPMVGI